MAGANVTLTGANVTMGGANVTMARANAPVVRPNVAAGVDNVVVAVDNVDVRLHRTSRGRGSRANGYKYCRISYVNVDCVAARSEGASARCRSPPALRPNYLLPSRRFKPEWPRSSGG